MALRPLHTLEICSGVGMLGEGLRAGLGHLGIETRTVGHIEREAYAAAVLAARIEEGSLDPAPIWSDLLTFDAGAWRGAVDCIVAGFPCQDLSIAGRRAGLDGKRSGLFFNILDIADACGARFLALENVAGIATATATVVDEAEGELEERAAARVLGELADRGWDSEWITLSASDVGASHGRARWFCFAWRREVGHAGLNARSTEHGREAHRGAGVSVPILGDAKRPRWTQAGSGFGEHPRGESKPGCCGMADTSQPGLSQRISGGGLCDGSTEPDAGPEPELHGRPLFAPGPADPSWAGIIEQWPWLAPATKPGVCGMADGLAISLDDSRAARLRCVGNGVVALQAAVGFVQLLRRAGVTS